MDNEKDIAEDDCCLVSVVCLRKLCDPFAQPPWAEVAGLTIDGVRQAMQAGVELAHAYSAKDREASWTVEDHIARIAYLVQQGWHEPIKVDVGVPHLGSYVEWPIMDGNHRLAAAIVRGDTHILASVSGCEDTMRQLFGRMLSPQSPT